MPGPEKTCATCVFIGKTYWGGDGRSRIHFCGKSDARRREMMKPTGDFAEDFMRNFRRFFDASADQRACRHYEEREPVSEDWIRVLKALADNGGTGAFGFFSPENRACERMDGKFVERDEWASHQREPRDGTRDWKLTAVGKVEVERIMGEGD